MHSYHYVESRSSASRAGPIQAGWRGATVVCEDSRRIQISWFLADWLPVICHCCCCSGNSSVGTHRIRLLPTGFLDNSMSDGILIVFKRTCRRILLHRLQQVAVAVSSLIVACDREGMSSLVSATVRCTPGQIDDLCDKAAELQGGTGLSACPG